MIVIRHPEHCPETARGAVVALGNFDGVHRGHQQVLAAMREKALALGATPGVMTFTPHPREFFTPSLSPLSIYPLAVKEKLLEQQGAEIIYLMHFTEALAQLSADAFIEELLIKQLRVRHVVTGEDFAFGKQRSGNAALLEKRSGELGYGYTRVQPVTDAEGACSSTRIRAMLAEANTRAASAMLGRPYAITGRVQHGDKRGRELGFPTANIALTQLYKPAHGVYAVEVTLPDGRRVKGVANLGIRPTVGGGGAMLEVHCFDFAESLYETKLEVTLISRLREERKFDGLDALKQQITLDVQHARKLLEESPA